MRFAILTMTFLFLIFSSFASATELSEPFQKNWQKKSVFFGVNQAWDYLPSKKSILSLIARDEYRKFQFNNFDEAFEKKYLSELKEVRMLGLKIIGVTDWVAEKMLTERLGAEKILVKVEGYYLKKDQKVFFVEWQLFAAHLYNQVSLIEPDSPELKRVPLLEREAVMREVLQL